MFLQGFLLIHSSDVAEHTCLQGKNFPNPKLFHADKNTTFNLIKDPFDFSLDAITESVSINVELSSVKPKMVGLENQLQAISQS